MDLAEKLRLAMNVFAGTVGSHVIKAVLLEDERDAPQTPVDGSGLGDHGVQQDWTIWHEEPRPSF